MDHSPLSYVSLLVSLAVGVWAGVINFRISRRTAFINTVTAERVKWIDRLRANLSDFVGLTHHFAATIVPSKQEDTQEAKELIRKLDVLRYLLKLQLNPKDDAELIQLIDKIPDLTHHPDITVLRTAIDNLVQSSQGLLKTEWDKVKDEAKRGDLRHELHREAIKAPQQPDDPHGNR